MTPDPWRTALDLLSKSPPCLQFGDHWRPGYTQNPRHSRAPQFTDGEALDFVKKCLREVLNHRAKHGRGCPPRLQFREETFMKDPSRRAYVLVIGGKGKVRPVYVKWVFVPTESSRGSVHLISFHQSDEADSP